MQEKRKTLLFYHVLWKEDRKMALSHQENQNKAPKSRVDLSTKDPNSNPASDDSLKSFTHGEVESGKFFKPRFLSRMLCL